MQAQVQDPSSKHGWRVALDTGGTFTDFVAWDPAGNERRLKLPSDGSLTGMCVAQTGAELSITTQYGMAMHARYFVGMMLSVSNVDIGIVVDYVDDCVKLAQPPRKPLATPVAVRFAPPHVGGLDAPALGVRILTDTAPGAPLPALALRLSTTRGTNALLEGRGARVGVLVSDGLDGLLAIADQTRDDLFARVPKPRVPLSTLVRAIPERRVSRVHGSLATDRSTLRVSRDELLRSAAELRSAGAEIIVVSLAHALEHKREQELCAMLEGAGFRAIAASDLAQHGRLLTRTETAVVHATIHDTMRRFVDRASDSVSQDRVEIFTSAGVLQRAATFLARDTLLSGPAGGANAMLAVAARHGLDHALGFDMGGTSTDVVRIEHGRVALRQESRVGRACVAAPSVAIDTVAAGGGSICTLRDRERRVGPESAGAWPGAAAMQRGGPLTLTDVNLLLGRIPSNIGSLALDVDASARALTEILSASATPEVREQTLRAFLDIANARMALAIERLAVRDAHDPSTHTLIAFGGAGGQHACAIADRLHMQRIVFPKHAGFLCAIGVAQAHCAQFATVSMLCALDEAHMQQLADGVARARTDATAALLSSDDGACICDAAIVSLRLRGQESSLEVPFASLACMRDSFLDAFKRRYGYDAPQRPIEIESVAIRVSINTAWTSGSVDAPRSNRREHPEHIIDRNSLAPATQLHGPLLVTDLGDTVALDEGWSAIVHASGDLVATRASRPPSRASAAEGELFAARLEAIALGMGEMLERTALSPNIRDRLDFSCAVLDVNGTLIQNAPHLPVHLGALGVCVREVMRVLTLDEGDVAVTNHPAFGGSHLPDLTAIAPVYLEGTRIAFVAVRAHHAELGGTRPGSFPPDATCLAEEGVVFAPYKAITRGVFDEAHTRELLTTAPYPSRLPEENLADLSAQFAALAYGARNIAALAIELGREGFATRAEAELVSSHKRLARAIARSDIPPFHTPRRVSHQLDDGTPIALALGTLPDGRLRIDFNGSGAVHPRNFNAPLCVTRAAVLYALRLFVDEPVPMNEGLLRAVDLCVPEGVLNPPFSSDPALCPPVVAGNVETSQQVVAAMIDALALSAQSQTTMNNVLFGSPTFGVYETIGGGAGAGATHRGADAVHVHMSNTRLTDIDVLERRAPVVIRRHAVRANSGGAGLHRGGDGIVRSYEFLAPVELSFFGSMRTQSPQGKHGGLDGCAGTEECTTRDGACSMLTGGVHALNLDAGSVFTVSTPGGGGFGHSA